MAYASETLSLAALELFVHLSSNLLPTDLVAVEIDVPGAVAIEEWAASDLPGAWDAEEASPETQTMGAAWVASGRTLLARVPSAVLPLERNLLINPAHPDHARLAIRQVVPFRFDSRMRKGS